jgi:hypothetical protein
MTQTARQAVMAPSSLPSFIWTPNPLRATDVAVGLSRTFRRAVTVRPSLRASSAQAAHTLMWITSLETTYIASSPLMHLSQITVWRCLPPALSRILINYFRFLTHFTRVKTLIKSQMGPVTHEKFVKGSPGGLAGASAYNLGDIAMGV